MAKLESIVQKHIETFCKYLPINVEKWEKLLKDSIIILVVLENYAEQLNHIQNVKSNLEMAQEMQSQLEISILQAAEEESSKLKLTIDGLTSSYIDLMNKIIQLEQAASLVNWEANSLLISGSGTQPPLHLLLTHTSKFCFFFQNEFDRINRAYKAIDIKRHSSMVNLKMVLNGVDLKKDVVVSFLAIIQYVNNPESVN